MNVALRRAKQATDDLALPRGCGLVEVVQRPLPLDPARERSRVSEQNQSPPGSGQRLDKRVRSVSEADRPVRVAASQADEYDLGLAVAEGGGHVHLVDES